MDISAILSAVDAEWTKAMSTTGKVAHLLHVGYATVRAGMTAFIKNGNLLWEATSKMVGAG